MTEDAFHFNEGSLEAERSRRTAMNLIATWGGVDNLEPGRPQNDFANDMILRPVLQMESREMVFLIASLSRIGSILLKSASKFPAALDALDMDWDEFVEEHGEGDPVDYLHSLEQAFRDDLGGRLPDTD